MLFSFSHSRSLIALSKRFLSKLSVDIDELSSRAYAILASPKFGPLIKSLQVLSIQAFNKRIPLLFGIIEAPNIIFFN